LTVSFSLHEEYTSEIGNKAYVLIQTPEALRDTDVPDVDKSALEAAIEDAKALNEEDYTNWELSGIEAALVTAEAILAGAGATQEEVDAAAAALVAAIEALETVAPLKHKILSAEDSNKFLAIADLRAFGGSTTENYVYASEKLKDDWNFITVDEAKHIYKIVSSTGYALKLTDDVYDRGQYGGEASLGDGRALWVCATADGIDSDTDLSIQWAVLPQADGSYLIKSLDERFSKRYLQLTNEGTGNFENNTDNRYVCATTSTEIYSKWYLDIKTPVSISTLTLINPYVDSISDSIIKSFEGYNGSPLDAESQKELSAIKELDDVFKGVVFDDYYNRDLDYRIEWIDKDNNPIDPAILNPYIFPKENVTLYVSIVATQKIISYKDPTINLWLSNDNNFDGPSGGGTWVIGAPDDWTGNTYNEWDFIYVDAGYYWIRSTENPDLYLKLTDQDFDRYGGSFVKEVVATELEERNDSFLWYLDPVDGHANAYYIICKKDDHADDVGIQNDYYLDLSVLYYGKSSDGIFRVAAVPEELVSTQGSAVYWYLNKDAIPSSGKLRVRFYLPDGKTSAGIGPYYVEPGNSIDWTNTVNVDFGADGITRVNEAFAARGDEWVQGSWYDKNTGDLFDYASNPPITTDLDLVPLAKYSNRPVYLTLHSKAKYIAVNKGNAVSVSTEDDNGLWYFKYVKSVGTKHYYNIVSFKNKGLALFAKVPNGSGQGEVGLGQLTEANKENEFLWDVTFNVPNYGNNCIIESSVSGLPYYYLAARSSEGFPVMWQYSGWGIDLTPGDSDNAIEPVPYGNAGIAYD
jgi:hypothetical protein